MADTARKAKTETSSEEASVDKPSTSKCVISDVTRSKTVFDTSHPGEKNVDEASSRLHSSSVKQSEAQKGGKPNRWHRELWEIEEVTHLLLASPDVTQPAVHVMYDDDDRDFVLGQLSVVLWTRLGLREEDRKDRVKDLWLWVPTQHLFLGSDTDSDTDSDKDIESLRDKRSLREPAALCSSGSVNIHQEIQEGSRQCLNLVFFREVDLFERVLFQLDQAAATDAQIPKHTLFILTRESLDIGFVLISPLCYLDLSKLQTPNFVLFPHSEENQQQRFWETVTPFLSNKNEDPTRRAMLNEFGLVKHAVLQSPQHSTVHVIYDHTNRHFVYSQLTEELKTRTGLQLVPPHSPQATTAAVSTDSVLIVIVDWCDSLTGSLLRQAVETSGHPDTHTLFIQKHNYLPDWVERKLSHCTLMRYPQNEWADCLMYSQRALGRGRPVFFKKDKRRSGLHLMPPHSHGATASVTGSSDSGYGSHLIDPMTDRLLHRAVEQSEPPDTHTPMLYPQDVLADLVMQNKETQTAFWDNLSVIVADKWRLSRTSSSTSVEPASEGKPISSDFPDALEQKTGKGNASTSSSLTAQSVMSTDAEVAKRARDSGGKASGQAGDSAGVDTQHDAVERSATLQSDDTNQAEQGCESLNAEGTAVLECVVSSFTLPGFHNTKLSTEPLSDTVQSKNPAMDEENSQAEEIQQKLKDTESDQDQDDMSDLPPPILTSCWQHSDVFDHKGGLLRKPGSDVTLQVPREAVSPDSPVVIHTAVCADVDHVREVLQLADDEQVVSPLAEYWAGPDFSFQRPVCITLPLCLPLNPDLRLLRVYRVTRHHDGHVIVTRVKAVAEDSAEDVSIEENLSGSSWSARHTSQEGRELDDTVSLMPRPESDRLESCVLGDKKPGHEEEDIQHQQFPFDGRAYFQLSPEVRVLVTTAHFSGYVCTYCGRSQGPPVLLAMVRGVLERTSHTLLNADVDLYLWDRRIEVADFRKEYNIQLDTSQFQGTPVAVLREMQDTSFYLQLTVLGPTAEHWAHLTTADGEIANPETQRRDLDSLLSCDAYGCSRRRSAPPVLVQWNLMAPADHSSDPSMRIMIRLSHVAKGVGPTWTDKEQEERSTRITLKVENDRHSTSTQTDGGITHDTEVKYREAAGTPPIVTSPRNGAFSLPPQNAATNSASGASYHPLPGNGSTACPLSGCEGAPCRENGTVAVPRHDVSNGSTSGTVAPCSEASPVDSLRGSFYQNCSITIHADTHTNNVNKMGEMNFGNNYTAHTQAVAEPLDYPQQQAASSPPGDVPVVEMPEDLSLPTPQQESGQWASEAEDTTAKRPHNHDEDNNTS